MKKNLRRAITVDLTNSNFPLPRIIDNNTNYLILTSSYETLYSESFQLMNEVLLSKQL